MTWARSLRGRVTLAAIGAVLLGLLLLGALLLPAIERDGRNDVDHDLSRRADMIFHGPGPLENGDRPPPGGPGEPGLLTGAGTFVRVAQGSQIVQERGDVPANAPAVPTEAGFITQQIGGRPWRSLTVPVPDVPGGRVQLLTSLAPVERRVDDTRRLVVIFGLIALALTAVSSWLLGTLALAPLARLRAAAARVSGTEDLKTRLPTGSAPEEVDTLSHALNAMLARLESSTAAMERALSATRRFAADAGHELRTPMTSLRANLDVLSRNPDLPDAQRRGVLAEITADQERIVKLLDALQSLARGDAARALQREPVDLGDVADAAAQAARRRHPRTEVELVDELEGRTVTGWPDGLRILLDNLLENAAVHGRPDGHVRVALDAPNGRVRLRVDDDGPGVPEDERERVLGRFVRGSGATAPGSGLGLAMVAQQAALHDGTVSLREAPAGGLEVEVTLPGDA
jgi:signal transduction histidine kinase